MNNGKNNIPMCVAWYVQPSKVLQNSHFYLSVVHVSLEDTFTSAQDLLPVEMWQCN